MVDSNLSLGQQETLLFYCCDQKARAACAQSFALRQQAKIKFTLRDHSLRMLVIKFNRSQVSISSASIPRSLHYCLFAPHICIVVFRVHPIRGESHIECNATGEVATTSPPFYNEPHRSHVLFVKSSHGTTSTSWSQHHFVAVGKPEWHVCKALHCGSKQQQSSRDAITLRVRQSSSSIVHKLVSAELPRHDNSIIACSCHVYVLLFFAHIPFVVNHTFNATPPDRLQHHPFVVPLPIVKYRFL